MKVNASYIILLITFLALACGKDTPTDETPDKPEFVRETVYLDIPWDQQIFPTQPSSWQGVMARDSISINQYALTFQPAKGTIRDYYPDQKQRDSIARPYNQAYLKCLAVERYLEVRYDSLFTRVGDTLSISSGLVDWQIVNSDSQRYALVDLFIKPNYYLLQAIYKNGHSYLLFNSDNGRLNYLWGQPHLAPDSSAVLVASNDQRSQYSANGLQFFTFRGDSLSLQWELGLENWGPKSVQWTSDDTLLIKREYLTPRESDEVYISDMVQLVISKIETNI